MYLRQFSPFELGRIFFFFVLTVSFKALGVSTHSLIHHFETVPISMKLQTTTKMWLLEDFKIQIAWKTLWKKLKLLILSNFSFFHSVFL